MRASSLICSALLAALSFIATPAGAAEFWRYTDADGTIHFVDSKQKIPARYREDAKPVRGAEPPPESADEGLDAAEEEAAPSPGMSVEEWQRRKLARCEEDLADLNERIARYEGAVGLIKERAEAIADAEAAQVAPLLGLPPYHCTGPEGQMVPVPAGRIPEDVTCEPSRFVEKEPDYPQKLQIYEDTLARLKSRRERLVERCAKIPEPPVKENPPQKRKTGPSRDEAAALYQSQLRAAAW